MATFVRFVEIPNDPSSAKRKTAKRFRLTDRHISDVINGTIQPAGRTKAIIDKYREHEKLLHIFEKVDRLKDSSPESLNEAQAILSELHELANNSQHIPRKEIQKCENTLIESIEDKNICLNSRSGEIYVSCNQKPQEPQKRMTLAEMIHSFDGK